MRAGDFILSLLIHTLVIVYSQNDTDEESIPPLQEPSNNASETILMVGIVLGSIIIVVVLTFMICPNFLCCWCPDSVRYCCVGYPQKKGEYVRQSLYKRQGGYVRSNQNEKKEGYLQNISEGKSLLNHNPRVNQGNQPLKSGGFQGNQPLKSGGVQGNQPPVQRVLYEPVQYKPLPVVEKVQMPPIIAPQRPYLQNLGYPSTLTSSYATMQPTLTPGPCPPVRYNIPMMPVGPIEVLRPPTGQLPVVGPNAQVLH